jgi:hypothetical protein
MSPDATTPTRLRALALVVALAALAAGCPAQDPDEGLALLAVTVDADLPAFSRLVFSVRDRSDLPTREIDGTEHKLSFGYYLPGVSGKVTVVGEARSAAGCTVGRGVAEVEVQPGQTSASVDLIIAAVAGFSCASDGAAPDAHDAGTGDGADAHQDAPSGDTAQPGVDSGGAPEGPPPAPDAPTTDGAPDSDVAAPDAPPADGSTPDGVADGAADARPGPENGAACTSPGTCTSGHCVDGVCCESACPGQCESCNQPGKRGLCVVAPAGPPADGRPRCTTTQATTCNGSCDGANRNVCHYPAGETICKAAGCYGRAGAAPSYCDGKGACNLQLKISCPDNVLCDHEGDGGHCTGACQQDTDCNAPDAFCEASSCFMKSPTLGWGCRGDNQCMSGHCVDGVCCESPCDGACQACNVPGSEGACKPVVSADDETCRNNSTCDAAGVCKQRAGTECSNGAACATGACIDGHCCQSPSCGPCEQCTGGGGVCVKLLGGSDPDTCAAPHLCNQQGNCTAIAGPP